MADLPFAEDVNYWRTGKSPAEMMLERAERVIVKLGGDVTLLARGRYDGRTAYCIQFDLGDDSFRIVWPVLESKYDYPDENFNRNAERQAATLLFHDTKARALRASIFGAQRAFIEFLILADGSTIDQRGPDILEQAVSRRLLPPASGLTKP